MISADRLKTYIAVHRAHSAKYDLINSLDAIAKLDTKKPRAVRRPNKKCAVELIFIAGAWGSGTTAQTGALSAMGAPVFGPHFKLNDPKTPNSYEQTAFRDVVRKHYSDDTLSLINNDQEAFFQDLLEYASELERGKFGRWKKGQTKKVVLKLPAASTIIPLLDAIFDLSVVLVHRPLEQIEATRLRRNWARLPRMRWRTEAL